MLDRMHKLFDVLEVVKLVAYSSAAVSIAYLAINAAAYFHMMAVTQRVALAIMFGGMQ